MKTYAVNGLMSYRLRLNAGKAWFYIHFQGRRTAGFGSCRAFFSTDDLVMQRILEDSPEFKSHKIYALK